MSAPKIIVQIMIIGGRIFGKALYEAGRQAYKNAQHRPALAANGEAAGVAGATSGSLTDRLTRDHRMTVDEARLILNTRQQDSMESIIKNYEHLTKVNSPRPPGAEVPAGRSTQIPHTSHYLLSKVVRARERLEAEAKVAEEIVESTAERPPN